MCDKDKPTEVKSFKGLEDHSIVAREIAHKENVKSRIREESAAIAEKPKRESWIRRIDKEELAKLCYIDHI